MESPGEWYLAESLVLNPALFRVSFFRVVQLIEGNCIPTLINILEIEKKSRVDLKCIPIFFAVMKKRAGPSYATLFQGSHWGD